MPGNRQQKLYMSLNPGLRRKHHQCRVYRPHHEHEDTVELFARVLSSEPAPRQQLWTLP